ncbi:hypothetical protein PUNSTDRAFT_48443 [Punctularia strigosozonata HHB-11173 SS5]|uniref:uncharacterized protein n=1 Tax=Punctularia strigosozonata (strain HHB-11173) TaxID=741275 RepID=UPI0004416E06|nr:uncharacterized protein PUNSTDRAFT_48443 [Punctularia strigosozonata HHB-11173 SS5]EIN13484.1 hypothetical protein PUNSTDRAFT_48443 [Punctularia strigosozonata HHB-11173 SS5]
MDLLTAERSCELLGRLGTPMLNALTMLEDMRRSDSMDDGGEVNVLWDDEAIWLLVIRHQEENLMLACGLANYVIATARLKTCTALTAIEAWDYLRDILLLVLTQHFFCEDMALALLICPSVCIALSELLRWTAPSAVRYLLSSPWTMTLCLRLERISETNAEDDFFHRCVKSRLQDCGGRLLRWVRVICDTTGTFGHLYCTRCKPCLRNSHCRQTAIIRRVSDPAGA